VVGPIVGLVPAVLLLLGNRLFGVSSNLRHLCAIALPGRIEYFQYDWRQERWNLAFALGILAGGFIAGDIFRNPDPVSIGAETRATLGALGIHDFGGLVPSEIFSWHSLATFRGLVILIGGGFLVGFGTAYAGGCTSGHGLSGIADLQVPSLIALLGFFIGGIAGTFLLLPIVL
jgi:uncharacterized membrane protein YedE/YeeE